MSDADAGITVVPINGEYHIVVKLKPVAAPPTWDWDDYDCSEGWGYQLIGEDF